MQIPCADRLEATLLVAVIIEERIVLAAQLLQVTFKQPDRFLLLGQLAIRMAM